MNPTPFFLKRNGLAVECFFAPGGKLQRKIETLAGCRAEYAYQFDDKGHLLRVTRDGSFAEEYVYNQAGQRVEQRRERRLFSDPATGFLRYDSKGRLIKAGDTSFSYHTTGSLAERCDRQGITKFFYGADTMLDSVILPSRAEIRYEYHPQFPSAPIRRFKNGILTTEYAWLDMLRLAACADQSLGLEFAFFYNAEGTLDRIRLSPLHREGPDPDDGIDALGALTARNRRETLHALLGGAQLPPELFCGTDQVGTLRVLTDASGRPIKEIRRDSFGVRLDETLPELFVPTGFAGGLEDPETGLVRFGWRDYDPTTGRFTAPDPLGDTGGDHDPYDYCIDDPVTLHDPKGLNPTGFLQLLARGKKISTALGLGGGLGGLAISDGIKSAMTGEVSLEGLAAFAKVAPIVLAVQSPIMAIRAVQKFPGATDFLESKAWDVLEKTGHAEKILKAAQFTEGFLNPNLTAPATAAGATGTVINRGIQELREYLDSPADAITLPPKKHKGKP